MLAKVRGWQCQWPVAVWSLKLCLRKDMEQILESHKPGGSPGSRLLIAVHAPSTLLSIRDHPTASLADRAWHHATAGG